MRPSDVLAHRRILLSRSLAYPEDAPDSASIGAMAETLPDASCYYVTEEMAGVAKYAARTMPDQPLRVDDPPTRTGFMLWDAPVSQHEFADAALPVHGAVWSLDEWTEAPDQDDDPAHREPWLVLSIWPLVPLPRGGFAPTGEAMAWDVGETPNLVANDHEADGLARILLATWTLMGQSLTQSVPTQADRAERRRSARAGLPTDLLVVRLRRLSSTPLAEDGDRGADYSHRWLVSGHWRNQWLPSKSAHRLQWIAAHVKGPDSKPLVIKEKVTAWIR